MLKIANGRPIQGPIGERIQACGDGLNVLPIPGQFLSCVNFLTCLVLHEWKKESISELTLQPKEY